MVLKVKEMYNVIGEKIPITLCVQPILRLVQKALEEFSTGSKLLLETSFTRNRSMFFLHSKN